MAISWAGRGKTSAITGKAVSNIGARSFRSVAVGVGDSFFARNLKQKACSGEGGIWMGVGWGGPVILLASWAATPFVALAYEAEFGAIAHILKLARCSPPQLTHLGGCSNFFLQSFV